MVTLEEENGHWAKFIRGQASLLASQHTHTHTLWSIQEEATYRLGGAWLDRQSLIWSLEELVCLGRVGVFRRLWGSIWDLMTHV